MNKIFNISNLKKISLYITTIIFVNSYLSLSLKSNEIFVYHLTDKMTLGGGGLILMYVIIILKKDYWVLFYLFYLALAMLDIINIEYVLHYFQFFGIKIEIKIFGLLLLHFFVNIDYWDKILTLKKR